MSILQTIDLKKYYGTEPNITRALDGVNFSVNDGEFVAVVGTSGSGKSTLLHMMGGLDNPTSGNVIVRDKELSKMNDEQLTLSLIHISMTEAERTDFIRGIRSQTDKLDFLFQAPVSYTHLDVYKRQI